MDHRTWRYIRDVNLGTYLVVTAAAYFSVVRLKCCTQNAGEISGEVTTEKTGRQINENETRNQVKEYCNRIFFK